MQCIFVDMLITAWPTSLILTQSCILLLQFTDHDRLFRAYISMWCIFVQLFCLLCLSFSALAQLVGHEEEHPACKN